MSRYKQLSPTLSLRKYNGQVSEILAGVKVMNKIIGLGMSGKTHEGYNILYNQVLIK